MITKRGATRVKKYLSRMLPKQREDLAAKQGVTVWDEIDGLNKGTENMVRKADYSMGKASTLGEYWNACKQGGYYTDADAKKIRFLDPDNNILRRHMAQHTIEDTPEARAFRHAMALRHEAYEARAATSAKRAAQPEGLFKRGPYVQVGNHVNAGVLVDEARDISRLYYGHLAAPTSKFREYQSQEYRPFKRFLGMEDGETFHTRPLRDRLLRRLRNIEPGGTEVNPNGTIGGVFFDVSE